jgi:protein-disulfide isomerase
MDPFIRAGSGLVLLPFLALVACGSDVPAGPSRTEAHAAGLVRQPAERFQVPLGDSPSRGAAVAKVTIVEFADFECPFCARAADTLERVLELYPDDVQVVFKHQPLPIHEHAVDAALAAEAARSKELFWAMHDGLFEHPRALGQNDLLAQAAALGLDPVRFERSRRDPALSARLAEDQALSKRLGVQGTPTFFINGRPLIGARPLEQFTSIIDEEIARANDLLAAGFRAEAIYGELTRGAPATRVAAAPAGSTVKDPRCAPPAAEGQPR